MGFLLSKVSSVESRKTKHESFYFIPNFALNIGFCKSRSFIDQRDFEEVELSFSYQDFQNQMFKAHLGIKFMSLNILIKLELKTNMSFQV